MSTASNFEYLVENSSIFIDKSLFIKQILTIPQQVILITMPRRFGKSLNLSMLQCFMQIQIDQNGNEITGEEKKQQLNYKMFAGGKFSEYDFVKLDIYDEEIKNKQDKQISIMDKQGYYPVIFLDFKDVSGNSYQEVVEQAQDKIRSLYERCSYLKYSDKKLYMGILVKDKYQEYYSAIIGGNLVQIQASLKNLSQLLNAHFGKKVYILIDEYDAPINKAFIRFGKKELENQKTFDQNGEFQKIVEFFKSLMSPALKGNSFLEKGVLTGVLNSAQSSMVSGLNNVVHYDLMNDVFAPYYGFDQKEIEELAQYFGIKELNNLKNICNGYTFGKKNEIYNPFSATHFFNNLDQNLSQEVWTSSGGFDIVQDLIQNNTDNINQDLDKLLNGEVININKIHHNIDYDQLFYKKQRIRDIFMSTLLWTGYLTTTGELNQLKTPNHFINKVLQNLIQRWAGENLTNNVMLETFKLLRKDDINSFQFKLSEFFITASYHDLINEKNYHNMMTGFMSSLPHDIFKFKSNTEAGKGRTDHALYDVERKEGYIFEYKVAQKKIKQENLQNEIDKLSQIGFQQIKDNKYTSILKSTYSLKDKRIKKIVIVFDRKQPYVFMQ